MASAVIFGPFVVDVGGQRLLRDGEPIRVQPKVFALIACLAERRGEAISRAELLQAVSPGVFVVDDALSQMVRKARAALGDDPANPTWIETVSKGGYRLRGEPGSRSAERLELDRAAEHARLVTITGPPGIGKTWLATAWATARGGQVLAADPVVIGAALGAPADDATAMAAALARRPTVIDDADDPAPIRAWLDANPRLRLILTAHAPLGLPDELVMPLGGLSPPDAARLFEAAGRRANPALTVDDTRQALVARLCAAVDHHPEAIGLVGGRLGVLSLDALAERGPEVDTAALLAGLELDAMELETLSAVVTFAGPAPVAALEASAIDALERLRRRSLVAVDDGLVRVGGLVRGWMSDRTLPEARRRHARWAASEIERLAGRPQPQERASLVAELRLGLVHAGDDIDLCARIALGLAEALAESGPASVVCDALRPLLDVPLALSLRQRIQLAFGRESLKIDPNAARRALTLALAGPMAPALAASAEGALANAHALLGDADGAIAHAEASLKAAEADGEPSRIGRAAALLAISLRRKGRHADAETRIARGLAVRPDTAARATLLGVLGGLDLDAGRPTEADRAYREAMSLVPPDTRIHAGLACNRAGVLSALGEAGEAVRLLDAAMQAFAELGDRHGEAAARTTLGAVLAWSGDLDAAERRLEAALPMHRNSGRTEGVAMTTLHLAGLARLRGQAREAAALATTVEDGPPRISAYAATLLAALAADRGDIAQRDACIERSRSLLPDAADPHHAVVRRSIVALPSGPFARSLEVVAMGRRP